MQKLSGGVSDFSELANLVAQISPAPAGPYRRFLICGGPVVRRASRIRHARRLAPKAFGAGSRRYSAARRSRNRTSRSVWSASSLLALSKVAGRRKAGASSTHSIRFAQPQAPPKSSRLATTSKDTDGLAICATFLHRLCPGRNLRCACTQRFKTIETEGFISEPYSPTVRNPARWPIIQRGP